MNKLFSNKGRHYLYRHIRLDKNEIFYIGIGTKLRRNQGVYQRSKAKHSRNIIWKRIVSKTTWISEIVLESDDYEFIQEQEIKLIAMYGRIFNKTGTLSNLEVGGKSHSGIFKLTEDIVKKFKTIHGDRYDYSLFEYKGCQVKSTFICNIHGIFEQTPECHYKSNGCKKCGNKSRIRRDSKIKNAAPKFIERIKNMYGDRFDYSRIDYKGQKVKVELVCNIHGSFWQYPSDLKQGHHCQSCGRASTGEAIKKRWKQKSLQC